MSRRSKRTDSKSDPVEHRRPIRRPLPPLPEVVLARRPAGSQAAPPRDVAPSVAVPPSEDGTPVPSPAPSKRVVRIIGQHAAGSDADDEGRKLLSRLLATEGSLAPHRLPVFEQRLKRLEENADHPETRRRAVQLRRALRTSGN